MKKQNKPVFSYYLCEQQIPFFCEKQDTGLSKKKGGQKFISAKKMEKQTLEELYAKFKELVTDPELREDGNKVFISYKLQINDKDFDVSVVITNGRAVAITGKRTYIYQIREKSCELFNDEIQTKYPSFQIYGGNGSFSVGRRFLFDSVEELVSNIKEFNSICEASVPQFESTCVNFLVKTEEEEEYDPTQEFSPVVEEVSSEKASDYVDSFVREQQEFCRQTFYGLAAGADTRVKGNDISFIRPEGDGSIKVTMDSESPEDIKIDYAYLVNDQELAYIAISNISSTYEEFEAFYNEKKKMLHVYGYVTPDKYLPDEPEECIETLKEAIHNSLEAAKKTTVSGDQVSANMQALMNEQLEEIKAQSEELESSRAQLEEERKLFEKEREDYLNERRQLESELEEEKERLHQKDEELAERESAIAEQEATYDEEKAKYALNMKNLTGQLAKLQDRLRQNPSSKTDSSEVAKLKSRLNSTTKARASMEKTLNAEIDELRRKNKEMSDLLLEKNQEIDNLKEDVHDQAVHLFDDERSGYLKRIEELEKTAAVVGEEMSPEKCENLLKADGVYGDVTILHGARNVIVSCTYAESYAIKIVFGEVSFVDVCKKIKRVDPKILTKLNNDVADTKFFTKEEGVYARKYISKRVTEESLRSVVSELIGHFDDDKKRR